MPTPHPHAQAFAGAAAIALRQAIFFRDNPCASLGGPDRALMRDCALEWRKLSAQAASAAPISDLQTPIPEPSSIR